MDPFLTAAAIASLITCAVHTFVGGAEIAKPLLRTEGLSRVPKLTAYYCWHMVTILLFAMGLAYGYAATVPGNTALVVAMTGLAASFAVLSLGLALATRTRLMHLPQWIFFVAIATLAVPSLV